MRVVRNIGPRSRPLTRRGRSWAVPDCQWTQSVAPPLETTLPRLSSGRRSSTSRVRISSARAQVSYSIRHRAFSRSGTFSANSSAIWSRDGARVRSGGAGRRSIPAWAGGQPAASAPPGDGGLHHRQLAVDGVGVDEACAFDERGGDRLDGAGRLQVGEGDGGRDGSAAVGGERGLLTAGEPCPCGEGDLVDAFGRRADPRRAEVCLDRIGVGLGFVASEGGHFGGARAHGSRPSRLPAVNAYTSRRGGDVSVPGRSGGRHRLAGRLPQ